MKQDDCIFCDIPDNGLPSTELCYSRYDGFPVSPFHMLVIPKKHYETYFDMPKYAKDDLWRLVDKVQDFLLRKESAIAGFNVGFNVGTAAGQSVMHAHIHIIPRYIGDMEDPKGGVRYCIPDKGKY